MKHITCFKLIVPWIIGALLGGFFSLADSLFSYLDTAPVDETGYASFTHSMTPYAVGRAVLFLFLGGCIGVGIIRLAAFVYRYRHRSSNEAPPHR